MNTQFRFNFNYVCENKPLRIHPQTNSQSQLVQSNGMALLTRQMLPVLAIKQVIFCFNQLGHQRSLIRMILEKTDKLSDYTKLCLMIQKEMVWAKLVKHKSFKKVW